MLNLETRPVLRDGSIQLFPCKKVEYQGEQTRTPWEVPRGYLNESQEAGKAWNSQGS
jgi:hypothetical protein